MASPVPHRPEPDPVEPDPAGPDPAVRAPEADPVALRACLTPDMAAVFDAGQRGQ